MQRLLFSFILLFFILSAQAGAVHEYQLKNGLKLIVQEDRRAPVVLSSIWYKVGGSYEHDGITGISHVIEHMMFRGTEHYSGGMFERIISDNGGQQNAMTGNDYTMYYQLLSADKLRLSFKLEADRMSNLLLSGKDFDKEIQVVMEERRMRYDDNPAMLTFERFMAAAHVNNPYHHQAIGWMTDLQNMTVEDVRHWYHQWYAPNNAVIVVVGDVRPEEVLALAKRYFAPLATRNIPVLKPRTEIPPLGVKHVVVKVPAKLPMLFMGYQTPTVTTPKTTWQPYALDVLTTLLGGSDSSRFAQELVRGRQLATMAQAGYDAMTLHGDQLVLVGMPAHQHTIADVQKAFSQEITRLQTTLCSKEELARVKAQVIAAQVYKRDSLMNQATDLGVPEMIGLSWRISQDYAERIKAITPQQIQDVAKRYLTTRRLTIAVLVPSGKASASEVVQPVSSEVR